jgi:N-carbamoylputrescine amidase
MIKAAMIQQQGHFEKERNIEKATRYVREATANGAKIVCLQELFNTIYFATETKPEYFDFAEPIPGPTIDRMCKVAQEEGIVLIAPIYERVIQGELYNTATVIGPNGDILGKYRKMSIPYVTGLVRGLEKYYFRPGNLGFPVFETPFGITIGILICFDRHFPEAARALALKGAELVLVPTATAAKTRYLWEIELRAHAIDNIYYVGGVNRVGKDEGGSEFHFYGSSFFTDPKGEVIAQAGDEKDEIIYADLDMSIIPELRNDWGFFRDRRPDAYGDLVK